MEFIKKSFQLIYSLILTFLLFYIFTLWSSVFVNLSNLEGGYTNLLHSEYSLSIFPIVLFLISLIPLLVGLIIFWKTENKMYFFKRASLITLCIFIPLFLFNIILKLVPYLYFLVMVSELFSFVLILGTLPIYYFIIAFLFTILIYLILYYTIDKKIIICLTILGLVIVLLILSFVYAPKLYTLMGCDNYTDVRCVGKLAAIKKDFSMCNNLPVKNDMSYLSDSGVGAKQYCIETYIRQSNDPTPCLLMDNKPRIEGNKTYLSNLGYCVVDYYVNNYPCSKGPETCDVITDIKENEFCKKIQECIQVGCEKSSDRIKGMKYRTDWQQCKEEVKALGIIGPTYWSTD